MKSAIKFALVGVALIGGAANAAIVNNISTDAGGSSLVLLVKDTSSNLFFAEDLGVQVSAVKSLAQLQADPSGTYTLDNDNPATGPLTVPSALNGYHSANLAAFFAANSADQFVWSILGSSKGAGNFNLGQQVVAMTSTVDQLNGYWDSSMVAGTASSMNSFFVDDLNANASTFNHGVSATNGYNDSTQGHNAPTTWQALSVANGAALGTAQLFYLMDTAGAGVGANTYASAATLSLGADGTLTYNGTSTVTPIPAAIWLLGSGLMGLVGIGRRKNV